MDETIDKRDEGDFFETINNYIQFKPPVPLPFCIDFGRFLKRSRNSRNIDKERGEGQIRFDFENI